MRLARQQRSCAKVDNLIRCEWFSQKPCDASLHQPVESILSNKSSAQNNWHVGSNLAQPMKRLFSVHERHCQIEQNQLECLCGCRRNRSSASNPDCVITTW